jgi:FixJ family two-component response regulator
VGQLDQAAALWNPWSMESAGRIAIVDDDAAVRKALARLLSLSNYSLRTYGSAREFLDSLPSGRPQCLILDLQMPEMTGLELHAMLVHIGLKIPTIVITAHGEASFREQYCAIGAAACLLKPLDESVLLAAVRAAMRQDLEA